MNNGPLLFLGILGALACSFWGLILAPQVQIGQEQPVALEGSGALYPTPRPGLAQQGAEVYRAQGCVECHSQQVRQTGVSFELWLADPGTNQTALAATIAGLKIADPVKLIEQVPAKLMDGLTMAQASSLAGQLTNGDAKAQAVLSTLGPDIQRGWGKRVTVARDFLYDYPVQLGNQRIGPDLANYGSRAGALPTAHVLQHLYAPQSTMPKSMMPPYRYLFNKRQLVAGETPSTNALPANLAPGFEITAKPEADALVAYLMSLKADAPLPEGPIPAPPAKPANPDPAPVPAP
jgi:cytochrome c oxidase cbb3-type subunit 2